MRDTDKTKEQLIDEPKEVRRRVAQFEGSATKGKRAQEDEKNIRDLAFLSRTAMGFLELSPEDDIYEFIGGQLKELAGDSIIIVNSFEEATDSVCVRAVLGFGKKMGTILRILGRHPVGMFLKIDDEAKLGLSTGKLVKVPGGLYEFSFRRISRTVCRAIEKLLDLGDIYAMGFAWKGKLFGSASILTVKGTELGNQNLIETFVKQASVALQRRQAEEALREARDELEIRVQERTRELEEANEQLRELYEVEKRQRAELEEEQKIRGLFVNILAHELRTPLTPLIASAGLLKDIAAYDPKSREYRLANLVENGAQTLASRLDELLDLARFAVGAFTIHPEPLDLKALLEKVAPQYERLIEKKKQSIILDVPQTLPVIKADRSRLGQLLSNLLSNATKFSPEEGSITVRARSEGSELVVEVEDHGSGLSEEEQERVFKPYHRVEQDRQRFAGLGLGLAVSKQIVEAHGGRIWVKSQLGSGSTFGFSLPLKG